MNKDNKEYYKKEFFKKDPFKPKPWENKPYIFPEEKNKDFINKLYTNFLTTGYDEILAEIGSGTCKGTCKSSWIRNLKYALKTKSNPLKLTSKERKIMTAKIKSVSVRNAINNN